MGLAVSAHVAESFRLCVIASNKGNRVTAHGAITSGQASIDTDKSLGGAKDFGREVGAAGYAILYVVVGCTSGAVDDWACTRAAGSDRSGSCESRQDGCKGSKDGVGSHPDVLCIWWEYGNGLDSVGFSTV